MPQDNQRSGSLRTDNTGGENARAGRFRSQKSSQAIVQEPSFGEMGAKGVTAGLRLQKEMVEVLSNIGREWFARATSQAELASSLPSRLTGARSVPDAISAYQEWLGEWMNKCGEDSYCIVSDSQRIIKAGVVCFTDASPAGTS
jgi:hypothetical protein